PGLDGAGTYTVTIKAQSIGGTLATWQNYTLVIGDTWAPTFTNAPSGGQPGMPYSYVPTFNESATITAHGTSAPFLTWTGSGYQGTPDIDDAGSYWISITAVSDVGLLSAHQNRTFVIGEGWAPTFTNSPGNGREAFLYSYVPTFNESVTITAHGTSAPFLTWTGSGYQGTPGLGMAGSYWIDITATSVAGLLSTHQNSTLTIMTSWAPTFTNSPGNGREAFLYSYVPTFNESATITAQSTNAPFLTWTGSGFQGTPGLTQSGSYWIDITAVSVQGLLSVTRSSSFTILDSWAPSFTSVPITEGRELYPYSYQPTCNETAIWTVVLDAPFLSWDGTALSGTPDITDSGSYQVSIGVTSVQGALTAWQNFTLIVGDSWAPTFTNQPEDGAIGVPYEYEPSFNESAEITAHATNAQFLVWKGTGYQGTPDTEDAGIYWIDITARSIDGTLTTHQNSTFHVLNGWAPTFTNQPEDGVELDPYEYIPTFNESVTITAHSTNAPFLIWDENGYNGTPQVGGAGTYWINLTALSSLGRVPAYQNDTFTIAPVGPPAFLSTSPCGPFFAPLELLYVIEMSEPCTLAMFTDADFLTLQGNEVRGPMAPGIYDVELQATSVRSGLTCWQNFTMEVGIDEEPPELIIEGLSNGTYTNNRTLELDLSSMDGDGSGGVTFWSKINKDPWQCHGQVSRITLELPLGTSKIQIKGVDLVGNEAYVNLTVHIDNSAPKVLHSSHTGDHVAPKGALSVAFSKAMDHKSVIVRVNGVPVELTWEDNVSLYEPPEGWAENTEYNVTVNGKDVYGNQLLEVSWTFRTGLALGSINGKITDEFGHPVVNATLIINGTVVAVTDQYGNFSFELPPGQYMVTVRGEGFEERSFNINVTIVAPLDVNTMLEWPMNIPWTIWLPLPFFLLEAVLIVIYRRRHR
ncbi:MAG: carboxypeptidase regulatory-like domain-containing protein, partial [Methanomassiliicoccales archaeon]|nr:carboxypeptidase regulatory-like domain-containing protein [Methanomassiliicoccales archaeon]